MNIFVTEPIIELINSKPEDINFLNFLSHVMRFKNKIEYRKHLAIHKKNPSVRPVIWFDKVSIGIKHYISEEKILIFKVPDNRNIMTDSFFDNQLQSSQEFRYS